jgi:hypothetical protein
MNPGGAALFARRPDLVGSPPPHRIRHRAFARYRRSAVSLPGPSCPLAGKTHTPSQVRSNPARSSEQIRVCVKSAAPRGRKSQLTSCDPPVTLTIVSGRGTAVQSSGSVGRIAIERRRGRSRQPSLDSQRRLGGDDLRTRSGARVCWDDPDHAGLHRSRLPRQRRRWF